MSILTAFRVSVSAHAAMVLGQVLSAGLVLAGRDGVVVAHEWGARFTQLACLFVVIFALILRKRRLMLFRTCLLTQVLFVLELVQTTLGYNRILAVHVPLAVAIVVANVRLFDIAFAPTPPHLAGIPRQPA